MLRRLSRAALVGDLLTYTWFIFIFGSLGVDAADSQFDGYRLTAAAWPAWWWVTACALAVIGSAVCMVLVTHAGTKPYRYARAFTFAMAVTVSTARIIWIFATPLPAEAEVLRVALWLGPIAASAGAWLELIREPR